MTKGQTKLISRGEITGMDHMADIRLLFGSNAELTTKELEESTGLSHGTVVNAVNLLISKGVISLSGKSDSTGGRKAKRYILNRNYRHIALLSLSRRKGEYIIASAISDLRGNVLFKKSESRKKGTPAFFKRVLTQTLAEDEDIGFISIAFDGVCSRGVIDVSDWEAFAGLDIGAVLDKGFGLPWSVENDVNAASIGLARRYPGKKNVVMLYQAEVNYTGCGMVLNGRLYNGMSHFAGEMRFLPWCDRKEQARLLKENPQKLLKDQMIAATALLNPDMIGWKSDIFTGVRITLEDSGIMARHRPEIIEVSDIGALIGDGLIAIAAEAILREDL